MTGAAGLADAGTAGTTGLGIDTTTGTEGGTEMVIGIGIEIGETTAMIATDLEAATETGGTETDTEIVTQIAVDHAKTRTRTKTKPTRNQPLLHQSPPCPENA